MVGCNILGGQRLSNKKLDNEKERVQMLHFALKHTTLSKTFRFVLSDNSSFKSC